MKYKQVVHNVKIHNFKMSPIHIGWSDPAAPTIRPPKVEENVEESVKVDDIAKLSVNEKEEVEIKVLNLKYL